MEIIEEPGGSQAQTPASDPQNISEVKHSTEEVLMDYEKLAMEEGEAGVKTEPEVTLGLIGGQYKDDERGIDVSKYEDGPNSKSSTQIEDSNSPYGTGPGNGMHHSSDEQNSDGRPENTAG